MYKLSKKKSTAVNSINTRLVISQPSLENHGLYIIGIITLMIIENRALDWLGASLYPAIITAHSDYSIEG